MLIDVGHYLLAKILELLEIIFIHNVQIFK